MTISRRNFVKTSISLVSMLGFTPLTAFAKVNNEAWRLIADDWMRLFLPANASGSAANTQPVWHKLDALMQSQSGVAQRVQTGFQRLHGLSLPKDEVALELLLRPRDGEAARFLRYFQGLVLDSYYSSDLGWQDLGFNHPIQPKGYRIKKT